MDWASLVLRFGIGVMFAAHGLQIAFGLFGGPGIKGFAQMLGKMGFAPGIFWALVVAIVQLGGGLFLTAGLFVRICAYLLLIHMVVAVLKVHLAKGFFLSSGGFEYNFIIICALIAVIILGPGKYSIIQRF